MQEKIKGLLPEWVNNESENFSIMLSDDIDSWLSCCLQKKLFNREVEYFIDFNRAYINKQGDRIDCQGIYRTKDNQTNNPIIGVDVALEDGYCYDNHVCRISSTDDYNENSCNINAIYNISRNNYYDKFCGSTLLQMMAVHAIDISKLSEEQLMVIASIDGLFTPFKVKYRDFKPQARHWLELLEYESLGEFIEYQINKTGSYSEFYKVIDKYNLNSKIVLDDDTRKLTTNIKLQELSELFNYDLMLPDMEFEKYKKYDKHTLSFKEKYVKDKESLCTGNTRLFNVALTNKDYIVYSTRNIIT